MSTPARSTSEMLRNSPEVLYGDTTAKVRAYSELSRRAAMEGNALLALHFAWAADINTVQAIIWERVMIASPRPDQQFFSVASTVSRALTAYAANPQPAVDAREALLFARQGLAAAFDDSVLNLINERYINLDHLAGLPTPDALAGSRLAQARLNGSNIPELSKMRQQAATDSMAVALGMLQQGLQDEALGQAYQADLAAFEAYLLDAAQAVGDWDLVTVEMRWILACEEIAKIAVLPGDFAGAVGRIREALGRAVGPIETERLALCFERVA